MARPSKYGLKKKNKTIRLSDEEVEAILMDFPTLQEFIEHSMKQHFSSGETQGSALWLAMKNNANQRLKDSTTSH